MSDSSTRQQFTKQFKDDAVQLVVERGYSCEETGRRLGVSANNISRWVRPYRDKVNEPTHSGLSREQLEAELKRLRKENWSRSSIVDTKSIMLPSVVHVEKLPFLDLLPKSPMTPKLWRLILEEQTDSIQSTNKSTREPSRFSINQQDIAFAPAFRLAEMVREGRITPRELVDLYLSRIRKIDPTLHSLIEVYELEAEATGELATIQARTGRFQGSLHGIPVVIKDLFDIEGKLTTLGSLSRQGAAAAKATSTVVKRLVGAGMIILGKTHTVEYAFGGWGTNAFMGTPRNPWDNNAHRVPGGSSSGTAVAVSAALAPAGIGTDTGGSVRIPASMCGIVSLKPTVGRISTTGLAPLSPTLDSVGPIVRSVEDAAVMYSIMAGPDEDDPLPLNIKPIANLFDLKRGINGFRLAVPAEENLEGVDQGVLNRFSEAMDTSKRLGAILVEIRLPESFLRCIETMSTIISAEAYHEYGNWIETHEKVDPHVRARIMAGKSVSADCYLSALKLRKLDSTEFVDLFSEYDAVLTPTTPIPAVTLEEVDESKMPLSRFTRPVNYYNCCAMSLPMGLTDAGLPTSLQIIAKPLDESKVLRIGWAFEQHGGLIAEHPPLTGRLF